MFGGFSTIVVGIVYLINSFCIKDVTVLPYDMFMAILSIKSAEKKLNTKINN